MYFASKETRKHAVLRACEYFFIEIIIQQCPSLRIIYSAVLIAALQTGEWKFKEQHAKMWENIAGAKRYSRPRGFNIAWASSPVAPAVPTPLRHVTAFRPISEEQLVIRQFKMQCGVTTRKVVLCGSAVCVVFVS